MHPLPHLSDHQVEEFADIHHRNTGIRLEGEATRKAAERMLRFILIQRLLEMREAGPKDEPERRRA